MHADRFFGAVVCILSLAFLIVGVPTISDDWMRATGAQYFTVGPRLFPYVAGVLCLLLGLLIALGRPKGETGAFLTDAGVRRRTVGLALLALGYAALLDVLGFVPASSLAMVLFMAGFGMRRWTVVLPVALLLPWLTALAFEHILQLRLPEGIVPVPFV